MPSFSFAQSFKSAATLDSVAVVQTDVVDLSVKDIFHDGPIVDGTPWPDLVSGFSALPHPDLFDVLDLDVLHPEPIIDGIPALEFIQGFDTFG